MAKAKHSLDLNEPEHGNQRRERQAGMMRRERYTPSMWSSPFTLMNRFAEEVERMFDDLGFGRGRLAPKFGEEFERGWDDARQRIWAPKIDVFERGGQLIVRADLPGLTRDEVKVEISDDGLRIQGERKQESEDERDGWYHSERSYGSFFRNIPLPEGVNAQEAKASFRDGVLEITMPAPQREGRRQIEVQ